MPMDYNTNSSTLKTLMSEGSCMQVSLLERIEPTISNASLESLSIYHCANVNFPIHHCHNFLVNLSIMRRCDSITTFSLDFCPNLRWLDLVCCNIQMITQGHTHNHLRVLKFFYCRQLESFPNEGLSAPRLEVLELWELENLKSLPKQIDTLLPSPTILKIENCPQVESILGEGLPSNLKQMDPRNCSKLIASLKVALGANTSLEYLYISQLESISIEGLPLNLKTLHLSNCSNLTASFTGGLGANTSLESLDISAIGVESFPNEGLLPLSLTSLSINNCRYLKKLDYRGLCHLSSLTYLGLYNCPSIQCLTVEGLPKSISTLKIEGTCPLIKRCRKPNGEDWRKIAHIENIELDDGRRDQR